MTSLPTSAYRSHRYSITLCDLRDSDNLCDKMTSRAWCFTVNNPESCVLWEERPASVAYCVWQLEMGESGTPHLQGYIRFKNSVRFTGVLAVLPQGAHVERRNGTEQQAVEYCKKEDTRLEGPWEEGDPANPGKRTDLQEFAVAVLSGTKQRKLAEDFPSVFLRCSSGMDRMAKTIPPPERLAVECFTFWGPTNTGKTHLAHTLFPGLYRVLINEQGKPWFDGYDGEETILFDDYRGEISISLFLVLLDRWPMRVECKGTTVRAQWRNVVITSNDGPDTWYSTLKIGAASQDALSRRLGDEHHVFHLESRDDQAKVMEEFK